MFLNIREKSYRQKKIFVWSVSCFVTLLVFVGWFFSRRGSFFRNESAVTVTATSSPWTEFKNIGAQFYSGYINTVAEIKNVLPVVLSGKNVPLKSGEPVGENPGAELQIQK